MRAATTAPGLHRRAGGVWGALAGSLVIHALVLGFFLVFGSLVSRGDPWGRAEGGGPGSGHGTLAILPVSLVGARPGPGPGADPHSAEAVSLAVASELTAEPTAAASHPEVASRILPAASEAPEEAPGLNGEQDGRTEPNAESDGRAPAGGLAAEGQSAGPGADGEGAGLSVGEGTGGAGIAGPPLATGLVPPNPLHVAVPTIPRGLKPDGVRGARIKLLLYVDNTGEVEAVNLISSSGLASLDMSAVDAARRLRYAPGLKAGVPTAMWTEAEISF